MAFTTNSSFKKSTDDRNSRYVQGGNTDIYNNRLGWWEKRTIERANDDIRLVIEQNEGKRPDLISNRIYGKPSYGWLILQYNNIVDIETEMLPGKELFLPSQKRLILDIVSKSTGGTIK